MTFALFCLGVAAEFAALIWFTAHRPWHRDMLGPIFAYVAIAGVFAALGIGAVWRALEVAIRRELLRRRCGAVNPLSAYVIVVDPQPTL